MTKTKITLVVLSEEPIPEDTDLGDILRDCDEGPCVLASVDRRDVEITPKQMAAALILAGSDPEFFGLDENGEKVDE